MCGRAGDSNCSRGPSAKGICPLAEACHPTATWHGRRKKFVALVLLVFAVTIGVATNRRFAPAVLKPGELSTPHAQILSGTMTSARCASCHPSSSTEGQFFEADTDGHRGVTQSDRCLDCHHTTMGRQNAMFAHNLPAAARAELRIASAARANDSSWHDLLPAASVNQNDVECAACHREHRGANGNLLAITDSQCQTCHQDRFGSFASAHPEWDRWPYGRGGDIAFNHASHANKHFPASKVAGRAMPFQCVNCHQRTAENEIVRSASYEIACGSCHDEALQLQAAEGIELLALPTIPESAAGAIGDWPESATGFYDGVISPFAELLFRTDSETSMALRRTGHDFGTMEMQDDAPDAIQVAMAHRRLLREVDQLGQAALSDRLLAAGVTPNVSEDFLRALSPQLISDASIHWFGGASASPKQAGRTRSKSVRVAAFGPESRRTLRLASGRDDDLLLQGKPDDRSTNSAGNDDLLNNDLLSDDLLSDDLLSDDLLSDDETLDEDDLLGSSLLGAPGDPLDSDVSDVDPLAFAPSHREDERSEPFDASKMLPRGGWFRDDLRMAIRYRATGHDDPVLRATVEMVGQLSLTDPVRKRLMSTPAVAACVVCHPAVESRNSWRSAPLVGRPGDFTKFAHGPHLNIAGLGDCRHCHEVESGQSVAKPPGSVGTIDFAPLTRQACAACHTPHAAGDACVKCHRYHIDQRPRLRAPTRVLSESAQSF